MKNFDKILDEIKKSNDDLKYLRDKKYSEFLKELWQIVKTNDEAKIEELKGKLSPEIYEKLEKFIKDENYDYYAFRYFRDKDVDFEVRKALLNKIYNESIIVSDYVQLQKSITKLTEEELRDVSFILHDITEFCASYNRKGKYLIDTLTDTYELEDNLCSDLAVMFDNNKISLKLDYIIRAIRNSSDEEKE